MKSNAQKILIANNHAIFREGLCELIEHWDDFYVVGEAENGRETLSLCRRLSPDIVLMDINMTVMSGVEATRRIRSEFPWIRVVMLTMSVDEKDLFEAIKAGVQGYVLKDVNARQLHSLLRGVAQGNTHLSRAMAAKVLAEYNQHQFGGEQRSREGKAGTLNEREIYILQWVVDGLSNAEIGAKLYLSEETIKKNLSNIMQKLQVNNRVQVAAYALREGLAR